MVVTITRSDLKKKDNQLHWYSFRCPTLKEIKKNLTLGVDAFYCHFVNKYFQLPIFYRVHILISAAPSDYEEEKIE